MNIEEIIAGLNGKDIDASIVDAIKTLGGELEAERGKHAGILEDKRKFKDRFEAAESRANSYEKELKALKEKDLTVEEKTNQRIEELERELQATREEREKQANEFLAKERDATLSDLTSKIDWLKGIPRDTTKLIVKNAFDGVEDLTNEKAVEAKLKEITENHKSIINADVPQGVGSKQVQGDVAEQGEASMYDLMVEAWPK